MLLQGEMGSATQGFPYNVSKQQKLEFQNSDEVDVNHLQDLFTSLSMMCSKQWSCPLMRAPAVFDRTDSKETG